MTKDCENKFLIGHQGSERTQKVEALLPENLRLNDFSVEDWMRFAYNFAAEVNYFSVEDSKTPSGNWKSFFVESGEIKSFLSHVEASNSLSPHLTLFICFLKLIEISKTRFNSLTKRHLDFYYKEILQIEKKAAVADSVHLIFELAKNLSESEVRAHTVVEAGKDSTGKKLRYFTDSKAIVNRAGVVALKSVYHHRKTNSLNPKEFDGLFAAPVVNSADGRGEPFKTDPSWLPFGYPSHSRPDSPLETPNLGFAVAAKILNLAEGQRRVQITFTLEEPISHFDIPQIKECFEVFATGEKGWIPLDISEATNRFNAKIGGKILQLSLEIDKTEKAITSYKEEIHKENFETDQAVFRFLLKTKQPEFSSGYQLYTELLQKKIRKIAIEVSVAEAKNLKLQNDLGNLVSDKPFYPFGTRPMERSAFYVGYPEMFGKAWKKFNILAKWLNTPTDFEQHYIAYRKDDSNVNLSPQLYYQTLYYKYENNQYKKPTNSPYAPNIEKRNKYVTGDEYFKATVSVGSIAEAQSVQLFQKRENNVFETEFSFHNNGGSPGKEERIKLSLNQSFLHSVYPKIYALALANEEDTLLPNEPYTPIIEEIELSYTASEEVEVGEDQTKKGEKIKLFHEHPFGHLVARHTLVPTYCAGGELYIGLENTEDLQQVQLLFQIREGTENPMAKTFSATEKIAWSVLSENLWMELSNDYLLGDTTDNFLKTGLVTIAIPQEATKNNTLLPSGLVWLRAKSPKHFDAVSRMINIHAQAFPATFKNNNNNLSHLKEALPAGSIGQLAERDSAIKKVLQPYNSFGGKPEESDTDYYTRVSQRIRHRHRAITLWDYEHLILEKFPEVYKTKCLNTTKNDNFRSAGNVSVVVVPDVKNKNTFNIFQPRLSTAKRNEIQDYINGLNSFFVSAEIINPGYEEVQVSLAVKFNRGFDEHFHLNQLEEDIKKYLSPWAYSETSSLNFGVSLHKNKLISYLENLVYVDFLENVVLTHRVSATDPYIEKNNIFPSNPRAILVSARAHFISTAKSTCSAPIPKKPTICLP